MTEWLELMLDEVRRKQAEQAEAEAETPPEKVLDLPSAMEPGSRPAKGKKRA